MAQRPKLIKRSKPKPVRKTRSEQYLVNVKYLGDEPTATQIGKSTIRSINWYNAMCSKEEAREYMASYLAAHNRLEDLQRLKKVSDTWLPLTACWLSRMSSIAPLAAQSFGWDSQINEFLTESFTHVEVEKKSAVAEKPSIQDRIKEKGYDIIGDIEEMLDKDEEFSLYDWLKKKEIPAMYAAKILEYYTPVLMELVHAFEGKDEQLLEGYKHYGKKGLKSRIELLGKMLEDAHRYNGNTKKARAPRKTKAPSVEKILKNFKYQKESNEHKLTSINPESILGAQTVWTFNTKYNLLSVFVADGRDGINVRGTSLVSYNSDNSKSIKIGRKTSEKLQAVLTGGKIVLRKMIEEMTGEANGRINENTIILKVIK
jgi:hypothetical protein